MNPWAFIIALLSKAPAAFDATARLLKAAKQSLRPSPLTPPEPLGHDAASYLRGANNEKWRQAEAERLKASAAELARKAAAQDDDTEPEKPS